MRPDASQTSIRGCLHSLLESLDGAACASRPVLRIPYPHARRLACHARRIVGIFTPIPTQCGASGVRWQTEYAQPATLGRRPAASARIKSCRSAACIAASSHATDGSIVSKKESIRAGTIIIATSSVCTSRAVVAEGARWCGGLWRCCSLSAASILAFFWKSCSRFPTNHLQPAHLQLLLLR